MRGKAPWGTVPECFWAMAQACEEQEQSEAVDQLDGEAAPRRQRWPRRERWGEWWKARRRRWARRR